MDFTSAVAQVKAWIHNSAGHSITLPSGRRYRFDVQKQYSWAELEELETEWTIDLPRSYGIFLTEIGASRLFMTDSGGLHLKRIDDLCNMLAATSQDDVQMTFSRWLPIGVDLANKRVMVFETQRDEEHNFGFLENLPKRWGSDLSAHLIARQGFASWFTNQVTNA